MQAGDDPALQHDSLAPASRHPICRPLRTRVQRSGARFRTQRLGFLRKRHNHTELFLSEEDKRMGEPARLQRDFRHPLG